MLTSIADFQRDYLLPAPATNYQGCLRREIRYDTAFAIQRKVLSSQKIGGEGPLQFWTPHSGRTFMPSATAALGIEKGERNYLGGWSAQVSKRRISNMQKMVINSLQQNFHNPLAEEETLEASEDFLVSISFPSDRRTHCLGFLHSRTVNLPSLVSSGTLSHQSTLQKKKEPIQSTVLHEEKTDKRRQKDVLGQNPREARKTIRANLQPGFGI